MATELYTVKGINLNGSFFAYGAFGHFAGIKFREFIIFGEGFSLIFVIYQQKHNQWPIFNTIEYFFLEIPW